MYLLFLAILNFRFRFFMSVIHEFCVSHITIFFFKNDQNLKAFLSFPSIYEPQVGIICETNFDLMFRINSQFKTIAILFYNLVEKVEYIFKLFF